MLSHFPFTFSNALQRLGKYRIPVFGPKHILVSNWYIKVILSAEEVLKTHLEYNSSEKKRMSTERMLTRRRLCACRYRRYKLSRLHATLHIIRVINLFQLAILAAHHRCAAGHRQKGTFNSGQRIFLGLRWHNACMGKGTICI